MSRHIEVSTGYQSTIIPSVYYTLFVIEGHPESVMVRHIPEGFLAIESTSKEVKTYPTQRLAVLAATGLPADALSNWRD